MQHWLITGGCGFIATHLINEILQSRPDVRIHNLDCHSYAGRGNNLTYMGHTEGYERYLETDCDISDFDQLMFKVWPHYDAIIHMAAESHVDRSINNPRAITQTNVIGTQNILELARKHDVSRYIQVSTDEVYGGHQQHCSETSSLDPSSPYAASKASADLLALSYHKTYGIPLVITRGSNTLGTYQYPEKLIPLAITNVLEGKKIPIYGDGSNKRQWITAREHALGILGALYSGKDGQIYNLGGQDPISNYAIATLIIDIMGEGSVEYVRDRLGHDEIYSISHKKASKDLLFEPSLDTQALYAELAKLVGWYRANVAWWKPLKLSVENYVLS